MVPLQNGRLDDDISKYKLGERKKRCSNDVDRLTFVRCNAACLRRIGTPHQEHRTVAAEEALKITYLFKTTNEMMIRNFPGLNDI